MWSGERKSWEGQSTAPGRVGREGQEEWTRPPARMSPPPPAAAAAAAAAAGALESVRSGRPARAGGAAEAAAGAGHWAAEAVGRRPAVEARSRAPVSRPGFVRERPAFLRAEGELRRAVAEAGLPEAVHEALAGLVECVGDAVEEALRAQGLKLDDAVRLLDSSQGEFEAALADQNRILDRERGQRAQLQIALRELREDMDVELMRLEAQTENLARQIDAGPASSSSPWLPPPVRVAVLDTLSVARAGTFRLWQWLRRCACAGVEADDEAGDLGDLGSPWLRPTRVARASSEEHLLPQGELQMNG